jgi:hypothetical protein
MITMKPVFYHKVGMTKDSDKVVFKYIFGSADPHFYFAAYIVPSKESYDIFYVPYADNFYDNNIINMEDDAINKVIGVEYGENVDIMLSNNKVAGFGKLMNVSVHIDDKPTSVNVDEITSPDIPAAHDFIKNEILAIDSIGLYELRNIVAIEVESKLRNILGATLGVEQEPAIRSIMKSIFMTKSIFYRSIPTDLPDQRKDLLYTAFSRLSSIDPNSSNIADVFAVSIEFARVVNENGISIESVPYNVFFRLMSGWTKDKNYEHISLLETAAAGLVKTEEITLNMSTMEDMNSVYAILAKTQSFVYLTSVSIENVETGEVYSCSTDNVFFQNFIKNTQECIEVKGIPSSNGTVFIQYGYGSSCDPFVGLYAISSEGRKYGLKREDKIVGESFEISRIWDWEGEHIEKSGGEIDDSHSIRVTFTGV